MGTKAEDSTRDVLQISCEIFGSHGRGRNLKKLVVSEKLCHSLADLVHKVVFTDRRSNAESVGDFCVSTHRPGSSNSELFQNFSNMISCLIALGTDSSFKVCLIWNNICCGSSLEMSDSDYNRIDCCYTSGNDGLELCDNMRSDHDRINPFLRMCSMTAFTDHLYLEGIRCT